MSLLTPSFGETVDRLTIIALKQEAGNTSAHLEEEGQALTALLAKKCKDREGVLLIAQEYNKRRLYDRLAAVNAFIWHKEDEIRGLGKPLPIGNATEAILSAAATRRTAELAVQVRKLADRRHELIAEIDQLVGDPRAGKEKSWMRGEGGVAPSDHAGLPAYCPRCATQPCRVNAAKADAPFDPYKYLEHRDGKLWCPHCHCQVIA